MGKKIYAVDTVYEYRSDTLANWETENPVLYRGEPVIVLDGENGDWLKIGDGATPFKDLPYKRGPQGPKGEKGVDGTISFDELTEEQKESLKTGVGERTAYGGEIFNDYENNKAISKHTSVRGSGNQAGSKGFRVLKSEFNPPEDIEYNENLIPFPYEFMTDFDGTFPYVTEKYGITITVNEDKSIVLNGTPTVSSAIINLGNVDLSERQNYYLSGCPEGGLGYVCALHIRQSMAYDTGDGYLVSTGSHDSYNIGIEPVELFVAISYTFNNTVFKPKLEKGDHATSFYPPRATVTCELEDNTNGLSRNDIVSLRLNYNHLDVGAITDIKDKTVTVTLEGNAADYVASQFDLKSAEAQAECPWYNTLSVNAKPEIGTVEIGMYASADGLNNNANRTAARASGEGNQILADFGSADGQYNKVGYGSHASGRGNEILGEYCEGNGQNNYITKKARYSHIDGCRNKLTDDENETITTTDQTTRLDANYIGGFGNVLKGFGNFITGMGNKVIGKLNMVSGNSNTITAPLGRAGGLKNQVIADLGDAYGNGTVAGNNAASRGYLTRALGWLSAAFGYETFANYLAQFVVGKHNLNKSDTYFEVGNGTSDTARSNAFEVKKNGSIVVGGVTLTPAQLQALLNLLNK